MLMALALVLAAAPGDSPGKLVREFFRARKEEDRAKARAAIEAAPALEPREIGDLRDEILKSLARAGRAVPPKGRNEWFDEKKDGWKGLFHASFSGRKGLVLALHGGGAGSGDAGSAQSAFSGSIGSLGMSALFPEVLRKTEYGWTDPPETERWVMDLLRRARVSWGVDPDRVYVTGHSMGGYGTWTYGSIYADAFAAGAAFAGAPTVYWRPGMKDREAEDVVEGYLPNLYNLPLFVFQSLDDPNVPAAANVFAMGALQRLHRSDPRGWKHLYEEVDGLGHGFPRKGPKPGLEWAASHPRDPRPAKVVWQPTREWKNTFYWIRWEEPWLRSILTATVDRERNAVDIVIERPRSAQPLRTEAEREERVRGISVYLDERLLDVSREVVVTVDGKVRHRGVPEARLATLLRSCEEREDPGYAFAHEARAGPAEEAAASGGR